MKSGPMLQWQAMRGDPRLGSGFGRAPPGIPTLNRPNAAIAQALRPPFPVAGRALQPAQPLGRHIHVAKFRVAARSSSTNTRPRAHWTRIALGAERGSTASTWDMRGMARDTIRGGRWVRL